MCIDNGNTVSSNISLLVKTFESELDFYKPIWAMITPEFGLLAALKNKLQFLSKTLYILPSIRSFPMQNGTP